MLYASMVQSQIEEVAAIASRNQERRGHVADRAAVVRIRAAGSAGVQLASTGRQRAGRRDAARCSVGLVLREPPPKDMPMPINIRISGTEGGLGDHRKQRTKTRCGRWHRVKR